MVADPVITRLLYEEESTSLDFKRDQYKFVGGSDAEKAELVKDILAFANAWRRSDAYILIGIEEQPGSKALVVGVANQLSDASLQQLVNSKTNAPVEFAYASMELEGKQIGIVRIPLQDRPRFLRKPFGALKENIVYVRRGSSTAIAAPDEVAKMGAASVQVIDAPILRLTFADAAKRITLASPLNLTSLFLDAGDLDQIPDYDEVRPRDGLSFPMPRAVNRSYNRQIVHFTLTRKLYTPVEFAIVNESEAVAHDVRVSLVASGTRPLLSDDHSWPDLPERGWDTFPVGAPRLHLPKQTDIHAKQIDGRWLVDMSVAKVQPHTTTFVQGTLYVGAVETSDVMLVGRISADNIPLPQEAQLTIHVDSQTRAVTLRDILQMENERFLASPERQKMLARIAKKRK